MGYRLWVFTHHPLPITLFNRNLGLIGIRSGTIFLVEGCHLVIKVTLSVNIWIYYFKLGLTTSYSDCGYNFKVPLAAWAVVYLRLGFVAVKLESGNLFIP